MAKESRKVLDNERFPTISEAGYYTRFYVFRKPNDGKSVPTAAAAKRYNYIGNGGRTACFSALSDNITAYYKKYTTTPNRVLYTCDFVKHSVAKWHVPVKMREWWVKECKKHGLMPKFIGKHFWETGNYLIRIGNLDLNQMYLYLVSARALQELPGLVWGMHYMVAEEGMDFFAALVIAHKKSVLNTGHSLLNVGRSYDPKQNKLTKTRHFNTKSAYGLLSFIKHYTPTFVVKDFKSKRYGLGSFSFQDQCFKMAKKVPGSNKSIPLEEFIDLKIKVNLSPSELPRIS